MANNPTTNNIQMAITDSAANGTIVFPETTEVNDTRSLEQLQQLVNTANEIKNSLNAIATGRGIASQINTRNAINDRNMGQGVNYRNTGQGWQRSSRSRSGVSRDRSPFDDMFGPDDFQDVKKGFLDSFEQALIDGLLGSGFKDEIKRVLDDVAKKFGKDKDASDLPGEVGRHLAQNALKGFKNTEFGKKVTDKVGQWRNGLVNNIRQRGSQFVDGLMNGQIGSGIGEAAGKLAGGDPSAAIQLAQSGLANAGKMATSLASHVGKAVSSIGEFLIQNPYAIAAVAAVAVGFVVLKKATETLRKGLKDIGDGFKDMLAAAKKAANRDETSRAKNIELANKRLQADIETLVKTPFDILTKAAEEWYSAWDNNLRVISATQGYTKADVQDLMSAYSQRLQAEGLTAYVSGASITDNLAKVLQAGLSGAAAEEFAYQATKLNAAVPTQDFFQYASTYASVAANAMKAGATQQEALAQANKSLESFTSGLIYAGRQLSGGFSTGLTDAASIYEQAAKIAQTSENANMTDIASVLLAVRGEVGAVAPDLASSITDTIYKMLTGGNSSDVVALRSLAGVNASNTEFLRAVSQNPQKIFSTLFSNLSKMYTQSPDAYMEKAEGYAELFGMSSEAFARIDFESLSSAISNMNMSDQALNENMELLLDGETTINQEQLKNREINQYMIEHGLSLVLDNEAARAIQEHMWDEQRDRAMQEATYAVDLQGESMAALNKVLTGINNIINLINPLGALKKIGNLVGTITDAVAQNADLRQVLELGKVGSGNSKSLYQLTTRNADLNIVDNLVSMMGGVSAYKISASQNQRWQKMTNPVFTNLGVAKSAFSHLDAGMWHTIGNVMSGTSGSAASLYSAGPSSKYNWGTAGKSSAAAVGAYLGSKGGGTEYAPIQHTPSGQSSSSVSASAAKAQSVLRQMLSDEYLVEKFVNKNKTYEDWASSAARFGIRDLDSALADAGYTKDQIEGYFQTKETERGAEEQARIREEEKIFRDTGIAFWTETFWTDYKDPLIEHLETIDKSINLFRTDSFDEFVKSNWEAEFIKGWIKEDKTGWRLFTNSFTTDKGLFTKFYNEFMKYFVNHEYYSKSGGYTYADVEKIQKKADKKEHGDTIYALSEMLTGNLLDLTDPQMQTNALLAQILVVLSAIHSELNTPEGITAGADMADTLSGMATGGWFSSTFSNLGNLGINTATPAKTKSTASTKKAKANPKKGSTSKK